MELSTATSLAQLTGFLLVLISSTLKKSDAYMVGNDPYHRVETLDAKGKYQLEWKVDWTSKRITFNVSVETKGYVGFGLSQNGKMTGADIVIGGVMPSGKVYFSDRHAVANQMPVEDPSQDWTLHEASESKRHTFLSFSRAFDTCDPQDYPITENKISLIWAYGERDNDIVYHHRNRGEYPVYLIHPDYTPATVQNQDVGARFDERIIDEVTSTSNRNLKVWTVHTRMEIPSDDTFYWCTIHKAPSLPRKHHVVGFEVRFADDQSRNHVHHLGLHRCRAPEGIDDNRLFGSYNNQRGQHCFSLRVPTGPMPTEYCTEFYSVWGVGGRPIFFPPEVGFPFSESKDEYYLLQVHYDNPAKLSNVMVNLSLDYYYTSQVRPIDGSILEVRHTSPGLTPSLLIPPSSINQMVYGFCGSDCTREFLPREGINVFGLLLHSHNVGVEMKLQQFRGNKELPWIQSDDNYAFDYQQIRVLNREAKVVPGDLLAVRCTYDNTKVNGTVVGGYSSQMEMCAAFIYYYTKISNFMHCSSQIESEMGRRNFLGIGNITWSSRDVQFLANSAGPRAGMRITEISDNFVNWNLETREKFQNFQLREPQVGYCSQELYSLPYGTQPLESPNRRRVSYPYNARPYREPQGNCFLSKKTLHENPFYIV